MPCYESKCYLAYGAFLFGMPVSSIAWKRYVIFKKKTFAKANLYFPFTGGFA